jgi:hypothetical protein
MPPGRETYFETQERRWVHLTPMYKISTDWGQGGFCGYRNIQMLSSYIIEVKSQCHEVFDGKVPTIFDIQDCIEDAWDLGINAHGRIETGGIRGTRKYIGTPEVSRNKSSLMPLQANMIDGQAQAVFCSLGIA